MHNLPEILPGVGWNLTDLSKLPILRRGIKFALFDDKEVHDAVVRQEEIAQGERLPVELRLGGRQLWEQLKALSEAGFKINLQKPEPKWVTHLKEAVELGRLADLGIITKDTLPFFKRPTQDNHNQVSSQSLKPESPFRSVPARVAAAIVISGAFYGGAQLLNIEATQVPDLYGPEMTREQLEANPQTITATDYVNDSSGNVVKQRAVLGGYIQPGVLRNPTLYESVKNPNTGVFENFRVVSTVPMGNVTSLISSADGNTLIAGGEDPKWSANTKLVISYDAGRTWNSINWPYQLSGSTSDLIRFTDNNYLGNNGNYEGGIGQFVMQIDPATRTATVRAASLTVQATRFNIGSAHDLRVASVIGNNVQMYSAGSLNLQKGFVKIDMDYATGIGSAQQITQTLINGQVINLGHIIGTGTYRDASGNLHLEGSNYMRSLIYDINPNNPFDGTSTQFYYGNLLDGVGIPHYVPGFLTVGAFGAPDANGNKTAILGGGYFLDGPDGSSKAIVFNRNTLAYYNLSPNTPSGIGQQDLLRKKINGQLGYEVNIENLGKAFIPDGATTPVYTGRGIGVLYKVWLPVILKNN